MTPDEIIKVFAEEFGTSAGCVKTPGGRGSRHHTHIRWAVAVFIAERIAKRRANGTDKGYAQTGRLLGMDHTSVMHAVEQYPRLLENPHYARKVRMARARVEAKELATRGCTA